MAMCKILEDTQTSCKILEDARGLKKAQQGSASAQSAVAACSENNGMHIYISSGWAVAGGCQMQPAQAAIVVWRRPQGARRAADAGSQDPHLPLAGTSLHPL